MHERRAVGYRLSRVAKLSLFSLGCAACSPTAGTLVTTTVALQPATCNRALIATQEDSLIFNLTTADIQILQRNDICTYDIPEYNDEQAFTDGANGYGPVVHAYAHASGRIYTDHTAFDNGWIFVAIVKVDPGTIPASYDPLKLKPGYNCLYVHHNHLLIVFRRWQLGMGPLDSVGKCSGGTIATLDGAHEQPSGAPSDYPVAARFLEGPNRKPTLGVRCGNVWCVGGANGNSDITAPAFTGLTGVLTSSRWSVKGWFDDQTLTVSRTSGGLGPLVRLAVVPHDKLGLYQVSDFVKDWIEVATILVPPGVNLGKYGMLGQGGFGLAAGTNTLYIRAGGTATAPSGWKARIVNTNYPQGHEYGKDVHWSDHRSLGIPIDGTARWRWDPLDEQLWVRCDVGCCLVYGES